MFRCFDLILSQFSRYAQKNLPVGNADAPTGFLCLVMVVKNSCILGCLMEGLLIAKQGDKPGGLSARVNFFLVHFLSLHLHFRLFVSICIFLYIFLYV